MHSSINTRERNVASFHLQQLPESATMVLIGKRLSGKTTTIMNILHHFMYIFEFGFIVCASNTTCETYATSVPKEFIVPSADGEFIEKIIQFQEKRSKLGTIKPIFIVFDDLNFDQKLLRSTSMFKLFANGRHYKIFILLSLQYLRGIGPNCRGNIDAVILHRETVIKNQRKLFDDYACGFQTFDDFRSVFEQVASNRRIMVMMKCEEQKNDFPVYTWLPHYPLPNFKINIHGHWWKASSMMLNNIFNFNSARSSSLYSLSSQRNNMERQNINDKLLISTANMSHRDKHKIYQMTPPNGVLQPPRRLQTTNHSLQSTCLSHSKNLEIKKRRHEQLVERLSRMYTLDNKGNMLFTYKPNPISQTINDKIQQKQPRPLDKNNHNVKKKNMIQLLSDKVFQLIS